MFTLAVSVQDVECGDEELVRVLLFIPGQMARVGPHQVQQFEWDVRRTQTRVELKSHKH